MHEAVHCHNLSESTSPSFSVTFIVLFFYLYMASRETDKMLLLSAMLGSKDEATMM